MKSAVHCQCCQRRHRPWTSCFVPSWSHPDQYLYWILQTWTPPVHKTHKLIFMSMVWQLLQASWSINSLRRNLLVGSCTYGRNDSENSQVFAEVLRISRRFRYVSDTLNIMWPSSPCACVCLEVFRIRKQLSRVCFVAGVCSFFLGTIV